MNATILSIGDELTLGQCLDTNGAWLSDALFAHGIPVVEHRTVPDDRARQSAAIAELAARSDVLVMTGGLGPTDDDLTREALGDACDPGRPLVVDDASRRTLEVWFRGRGRPLLDANLRQATRPETARCLPNPNGTAPGLAARVGACLVFALPGPPREMKPMFDSAVAPALPRPDRPPVTAIVRAYGIGESDAAARLGPLTARDHDPLVGTTASSGVIAARVRTLDAAALDRTLDAIEEAWAPYSFGRGETTLAGATLALLRAAGATLAVAESCTGGWLGKTIVDEPGASDVFAGGWITYSNAMKTSCLGVPDALFAAHGAVSDPVARAMAAGAATRAPADRALAITGVAGPGDAGPDKPAGTVYIGLARRGENAGDATVRRFRFRGEREVVRDRAVKAALQMLRFEVLGVDPGTPLIWEAAPERADST